MKRIGLLALLLTLTGCSGIMDFFTPGGGAPQVVSVTPSEGATNVAVGTSVVATLDLPNGGVNLTSVDTTSVRLVDAATGTPVEAQVTPDNDTETLTLVPRAPLAFRTSYRFEVTSGVSDEDGQAFGDYSSSFTTVSSDTPSVLRSRPGDGEEGVSPTVELIVAELANANGGVDRDTITEESVYLVETSSVARVPGGVGSSGAGDTITFNPASPLSTNTTYQFNVTSAVTDLNDGAAFAPYTATFTTGTATGGPLPTNIATVPQTVAAGERFSSLAVDSSGTNLYALTTIGEIRRYPISADGTLGTPQTLNRLVEPDTGAPRIAIGLTFDPASTPQNPIVWVTHSSLPQEFDGSINRGITAFWSGKLTRLSGPTLGTVQDVVVGLPRSNKDHLTNSIAFNPAEPGVLYFIQGSNTAMGAPDSAWGFQPERALSGAVLRLDTNLLGNNLPLNVQTEDGGTYNPFAPNAPLTAYATGTRNSYDLVWHSNGNLYVPANGSAAGGNVPRYNPLPGTCETRGGYNGPVVANQSDLDNYRATGVNDLGETVSVDGWPVEQTLNDYLFKIEEGGYYGYPNPKRCEWILNGGAVGLPGFPSTAVSAYPGGTGYDPDYLGPAGDFGKNISPNGALEYKGSAFPTLQGKLLVVRYGGGDDVVAVTLGSDGNATSIEPIIQTPAGLIDPLDITENPANGYLYVSWYNERGGDNAPQAGITLLRPQ